VTSAAAATASQRRSTGRIGVSHEAIAIFYTPNADAHESSDLAELGADRAAGRIGKSGRTSAG
jgi:hypothetical protein